MILGLIDELTPAEKRVARAILAAYPSSATRSSTAIARAAGASSASVIRFTSKLGFPSLRDFHEAVRAELDARARSPFEIREDGDQDDLLETVIASQSANIARTLRRLTPEALAGIRTLISDASAVLLLGGRFSKPLADYLAAHLRLLRPNVTVLAQATLPEQIAHVRQNTLLIAFDFRRYQDEVAFAARHVKRRRGHIILVTDPYLSPAARDADRTLIADIEGPRVFDSYAAALTLLDVIVSDIVSSGGEQARSRIRAIEELRTNLTIPPIP